MKTQLIRFQLLHTFQASDKHDKGTSICTQMSHLEKKEIEIPKPPFVFSGNSLDNRNEIFNLFHHADSLNRGHSSQVYFYNPDTSY